MASIVLVHPIHGAKVAVTEAEAEYDSLSGWTRYNPATESAPAVENDNEMAPVKRRGRPPKVLS